MKYISAEQFLKADKEVQEAISQWWKPSVGDLYCNLYNEKSIQCFEWLRDTEDFKLYIFGWNSINEFKEKCFPLLTEGQLREFIEDITNSTVLTEFMFSTKDYSIICFENEKEYKYLFDNLGDNLLKALWKVANEIIK